MTGSPSTSPSPLSFCRNSVNTKNIKVGSPVQAGPRAGQTAPRAGIVRQLKPSFGTETGHEIATVEKLDGGEFTINTCYLDLMDLDSIERLRALRIQAADEESLFLRSLL